MCGAWAGDGDVRGGGGAGDGDVLLVFMRDFF